MGGVIESGRQDLNLRPLAPKATGPMCIWQGYTLAKRTFARTFICPFSPVFGRFGRSLGARVRLEPLLKQEAKARQKLPIGRGQKGHQISGDPFVGNVDKRLADITRIELALLLRETVEAQAKANQRARTGGVTSAKLPTSQPPIDTRRELAKAAGAWLRKIIGCGLALPYELL